MLPCSYNDLGGADQETTESDNRPILGIKSPDGNLPYPRRLRTGRLLVKNSNEKHLPAFTTPWVPYDEVSTLMPLHGTGPNESRTCNLPAFYQ